MPRGRVSQGVRRAALAGRGDEDGKKAGGRGGKRRAADGSEKAENATTSPNGGKAPFYLQVGVCSVALACLLQGVWGSVTCRACNSACSGETRTALRCLSLLYLSLSLLTRVALRQQRQRHKREQEQPRYTLLTRAAAAAAAASQTGAMSTQPLQCPMAQSASAASAASAGSE